MLDWLLPILSCNFFALFWCSKIETRECWVCLLNMTYGCFSLLFWRSISESRVLSIFSLFIFSLLYSKFFRSRMRPMLLLLPFFYCAISLETASSISRWSGPCWLGSLSLFLKCRDYAALSLCRRNFFLTFSGLSRVLSGVCDLGWSFWQSGTALSWSSSTGELVGPGPIPRLGTATLLSNDLNSL